MALHATLSLDPRSRAERERESKEGMWPPAGQPRLFCSWPPWDDDHPVAGRTIEVSGWTVGATGPPAVTVELGSLRATAGTGLLRPDVAAYIGDPGAVESGWSVVIALDEIAPGPARLVVTATDPGGATTSLERHLLIDPDWRYRSWLERREPPAPRDAARSPAPLAVWIDHRAASDEEVARTRDSLRRQSHPAADFEASDLDGALRRLAADPDGALVLVRAGDVLEPFALQLVAQRLAGPGPPDLVYCDDDTLDGSGRRSRPRFKPGWSPSLLLARDYIGPFCALSARAAGLALEVDPAPVSCVYELLLRLVDRDPWAVRIPDVLLTRPDPGAGVPTDSEALALVRAAVARRGGEATVTEVEPGLRSVRWEPRGEPLVSIVIPTAMFGGRLESCLESIRERTSYGNLEVVVVNNSPEQRPIPVERLGEISHRVVPAPEPFNYSRLCNSGVAAAAGEHLLFLNDDIVIDTPDWIERMLAEAQQPGVGIVGVKQVYPSGIIQQAGVHALGLDHPAACANARFNAGSRGHDGILLVPHERAAVGGSCALVPRPAFEAVGGFDEGLAIELNDVDLCLRLAASGRRAVVDPRVVVIHDESASRGGSTSYPDEARFMVRWERALRGDPFFNPNLAHSPEGELLDAPPSRSELALLQSRLQSDGPPQRPVALPVHEGSGESPARPSPERFEPETMGGGTIHAEHEGRYRWAAPLIAGNVVLDAGCGNGYGTRICAAAGAARAVGVDLSAHAIADATTLHGDSGAEFVTGDLYELPLADSSVDVVLCFEAIEHVAEPERALDELRRVLRPGGVIAVSSPNRGVYEPGNPHHLRELTAGELHSALRERFANVALYRQATWTASLIADDAGHSRSDAGAAIDAIVRKVAPAEPGDELFSVGLASDAALPPLAGAVTLSEPPADGWLHQRLQFVEQQLGGSERTAAEARSRSAADEARRVEAEWNAGEHERRRIEAERNAGEHELRARELDERARELERRVEELGEQGAELRESLGRARAAIADITSSPSWRLTAPLRAAKRALRRSK